MWKRILDLRPLKDLQKKDRCYFRVTEPHKNGTPHLHIALYVPKDSIVRILNSIFAIYQFPQIEISSEFIPDNFQNKLYDKTVKRTVYKNAQKDNFGITSLVKDPLKYLMKYILKTLDDLREDKGDYTELTLWYIHNSVTRFFTSKTLVPLWIYRKINYLPRFQDMFEASKAYWAGRIRVSGTRKSIDYLSLDSDGEIVEETIWQKWNDSYSRVEKVRDRFSWSQQRESFLKAYAKKHPKIIPLEIDGKKLKYNLSEHKIIDHSHKRVIVPARLSDEILKDYYKYLLLQDDERLNLLHFGITQNEMIKRGFLDMPLQNLNDFNDKFEINIKEYYDN